MQLLFLIPNAGRVHTGFFKSMIGVTQALQNRRIPFAIKTYEFSDLVVSRNYLMSYFLSHKNFTHALMADTDLEFDFEQIDRLLQFGEDFTCGIYPDRRMPKRMLRGASETAQDIEDGLAASAKYIMSTSLGGSINFVRRMRGDFATCTAAGGGFMLVTRNVVETMADEGVARSLPRQGQMAIYKDAPRFHDFFSHILSEDEDLLYGEDQSFFRRWIQGCGGQVWADLRSRITHVGEFSFPGDYSQTPAGAKLLGQTEG